MNKHWATFLLIVGSLGGAAVAFAADAAGPADASLPQGFVAPPDSARPWVYWFWLNQNITREGITADLEAMKRVGIGGVLIMEVDQGAPVGPVPFAGPKWRELFKHVASECARLGLEVNMNNDAGWCGSGGPWISPELSQQKLVWTETSVTGPSNFDAALPEPAKVANYYSDIAVLAFPTPQGNLRIKDIQGKAAFVRQEFPPPAAAVPSAPAEQTIPAGKVLNLTAQFQKGRLSWQVPEGKWTVLRLGHTSTGNNNAPAPASGRGLECDKLSTAGADAAFAGLMGKLVSDVGPLVGKALVSTHIDSWEVGSQNWTPRFREEFQKRRGYDPLPLLPIVTGRVVDSLDASERFLWDLRQTVSDLLVENYAGRFHELANKNGLRLSIEAYDGCPCDDMAYAGRCDEPMAEFWSTGNGTVYSCVEMSAAAHVYGKRILGAEAFTATDAEKWRLHPATIKTLGDWAFCEGINRFVFHRYAMQPWLDRRPGMSMGPWGLHYERTETWWEQSKPWHEYLARCQFLLQQGLFVADLCCLQPEGSPRRFTPPWTMSVPLAPGQSGDTPDRPGYNFDGCSPEAVLTRLAVRDGRLVLPDGMSYRALVLPECQTITPRLLARIAELVEAGATVIGPRPVRSPSLTDYPQCDKQIEKLADRLWGDCDGKTVSEHRAGEGRVVWGKAPKEVLAAMHVPPDFACEGAGPPYFRFIHRRLDDGTEVYFVANKVGQAKEAVCAFRVTRKRPELWWPESGLIEPAARYVQARGVTRIPLQLEAAESVFVVFRPAGQTPAGASPQPADPVVSLTCNGKAVQPIIAARVPIVIQKARYGIFSDPQRTRDVRAKLQALVNSGVQVFQVAEMATGDDPALNVVKTLEVDYTLDGAPRHASGHDPDVITLAPSLAAARTAVVRQLAPGQLMLEAWKAGRYELRTASGRTLMADLPPPRGPQTIAGPWELQVPAPGGPPRTITLEKLISWGEQPEEAVKYFSGTAVYRKTFRLASAVQDPRSAVYLDLGDVQIMAEVKINGRNLGLLWKPPYRVEITAALQPGENTLEIAVTNLWINRMIGDEQLPEDSDRNPNGTLRAWPKWLAEDKPSPTGRQTFTSWRLWKKDSPLVPSGLLGPVMLQTSQRALLK
jgi:hypothetical protein